MRLSSQDKRLIKATKGRCFYCGFPIFAQKPRDWLLIKQHRTFQADHKIPQTRSGSDDDENMLCSCRSCNGSKNNLTVEEFRLLCGLRRGDLNFVFALEKPKSVQRDWLCLSSPEFEKAILLASLPSAKARYKGQQ